VTPETNLRQARPVRPLVDPVDQRPNLNFHKPFLSTLVDISAAKLALCGASSWQAGTRAVRAMTGSRSFPSTKSLVLRAESGPLTILMIMSPSPNITITLPRLRRIPTPLAIPPTRPLKPYLSYPDQASPDCEGQDSLAFTAYRTGLFDTFA